MADAPVTMAEPHEASPCAPEGAERLLRDLHADLIRRAGVCSASAKEAASARDKGRLTSKASGYKHSADLALQTAERVARTPSPEPSSPEVGMGREDFAEQLAEAYGEGQSDALKDRAWMQDKAWMDAVLMFNHYDLVAGQTWLVGADEAKQRRDEWRERIRRLAETHSEADITALAPTDGQQASPPLSTYPEDRAKLLALCAKITLPGPHDEEAAVALADMVRAILSDEAVAPPRDATGGEVGALRAAAEPLAAFFRGARGLPDNMPATAGSSLARKQLTVGQFRALDTALRTLPDEPSGGDGAPPADVVRLVVAARKVAYEHASAERIGRLDRAAEAFASRVPWTDEPLDEPAPPASQGGAE